MSYLLIQADRGDQPVTRHEEFLAWLRRTLADRPDGLTSEDMAIEAERAGFYWHEWSKSPAAMAMLAFEPRELWGGHERKCWVLKRGS